MQAPLQYRRRMAPRRRQAPAQQGFMLMEVLISVLIFSLGILGLVGLQASMSQAQTNAKIRADAAYLANEIVGQMWSDVPNLASYTTSAAGGGGNCAGYQACNDWMDKVARTLPNGLAILTAPDAARPQDITVVLTWTSTDSATRRRYSTATTVTQN